MFQRHPAGLWVSAVGAEPSRCSFIAYSGVPVHLRPGGSPVGWLRPGRSLIRGPVVRAGCHRRGVHHPGHRLAGSSSSRRGTGDSRTPRGVRLRQLDLKRVQLLFQRNASTHQRMQFVISQIQSQRPECDSESWSSVVRVRDGYSFGCLDYKKVGGVPVPESGLMSGDLFCGEEHFQPGCGQQYHRLLDGSLAGRRRGGQLAAPPILPSVGFTSQTSVFGYQSYHTGAPDQP